MHMYKKTNILKIYINFQCIDVYQIDLVVLNIDGLVIVHCLCNG